MKNLKRIISIFIVFLLLITYNYAQMPFSLSREIIDNHFSGDQAQNLSQVNEDFENANQNISEIPDLEEKINDLKKQVNNARSKFDSTRHNIELQVQLSRARQKRISASKIYTKAFSTAYQIYKDKLLNYPTDNLKKMNKANEKLIKATELYEDANAILYDLMDTVSYSSLVNSLEEIQSLKIQAINTLEEAFIIHASELPEEEVADNSFSTGENDDGFGPGENDDGFGPGENDDGFGPGEEFDYTETEDDLIFFRVQLVAVSSPLSDNKIKEIYNGYAQVLEEFHDGLYKYWAGTFYTYNEAERFRKSIDVDDAFVVAFEGDKLISIREAMRKKNLRR